MTQPIPLSKRKEEKMTKIVREFKVKEFESFDCDVLVEYVASQEVV